MEVLYALSLLEDKDVALAYEALKELEQYSETCEVLYPHIETFLSMIDSDKYVIRVRGFRLFCKQAKWDTKCVIDANLAAAMNILEDKKPTAVRQALAALHEVVLYKKELHAQIRSRVLEIDVFQYKDTMQGLILKDIDALLSKMDEILRLT